MPDSLLAVRDVIVRFGGVTAVDGVSFSIVDREITGIIGPNGAGKSTLMNVVSGFVKPRSGSVSLRGQSLDRESPSQRARLGLGRTFQIPRLFRGLTVAENVAVAARQRSSSRPGPIDVLEACGVADIAARRVEQLDAGQQRFVELARCLALRPRLVLLDEPATGLREADVAKLSSILRQLRDDFGTAAMIVSHDMTLIHAACDRVAMLDFGTVVVEGSPDTVCRDPRVIDAYLGQSNEAAAP
jgi:branched-chain amino acid transport system ATP-binding protein